MIFTITRAEWKESKTGRIYLSLRCLDDYEDVRFINVSPEYPPSLRELSRQTRVPIVEKPFQFLTLNEQKLVGKIISVVEDEPFNYKGRYWRRFRLATRRDLFTHADQIAEKEEEERYRRMREHSFWPPPPPSRCPRCGLHLTLCRCSERLHNWALIIITFGALLLALAFAYYSRQQ